MLMARLERGRGGADGARPRGWGWGLYAREPNEVGPNSQGIVAIPGWVGGLSRKRG